MGKRVDYPQKTEKLNGFFNFVKHNVFYAEDGIAGLKHFIPLIGDWRKDDQSATADYDKILDGPTTRIPDRITSVSLATGASSTRLAIRIMMPRDFGDFVPGACSVWVRSHDPAAGPGATAHLTLYEPGGTIDPAVNSISITPGALDTWTQISFNPTLLTYLPGQFATLSVLVGTTAIGQWFETTDWTMTYLSARGNV
jgi:hypothetical protein